ncbi:MAG: glycosyltransferase [Microbacterium sp.]|nr:MAG: glycosyltransferase [Microbacterium sp.]
MSSKSVLWVTNYGAPYRRPVWDELARHCELTVLLLGGDRALRSDQRRGKEWEVGGLHEAAEYEISHAPTLRIARGEREYFVLKGSVPVKRFNGVLLGGWESPAYWQIRSMLRSGQRQIGFYESTVYSARHSRGPVAAARRKYFRSLDGVVVPGIAAAESLRAMGIPTSSIFQGFNAVDVTTFARSVSSPAVGLHPHRFIYVGQLIARKNVDGLLRSLADLMSPAWTLTVVGDGPDRGALRTLADQLGISDRTVFSGPLPYDALPQVLADHHTLVLPSLEEVWGLVANEALAAGCHVVVSELAGVAPSIAGMRGVWVSPVERNSLTHALAESAHRYKGRQRQHEILRHTPEQFARTFLRALGS